MFHEIQTHIVDFVNTIFPPYGSDAYYGQSPLQCDDCGDEPDHLDKNSSEGRKAWNDWLQRRGYPTMPELEEARSI